MAHSFLRIFHFFRKELIAYWCFILISVLLFVSLAVLNVRGVLHRFDLSIMHSISKWAAHNTQVERYNEMMRDVTSLGGTTVVILVTSITTLALFVVGDRARAVFMAATVLTSSILSTGLKQFFDLPRPDVFPYGMPVSSATFPSGHTLTGTVVYLTIAFLVSQLAIRQSLKIFAFCAATLSGFSIGISRLYLGVHWPTDVIAGWILAAGWCSLCWMIWRVCFGIKRAM